MTTSTLSLWSTFLVAEALTPSNAITSRATVMYSYRVPVVPCSFSFVYPAYPDPRYAI